MSINDQQQLAAAVNQTDHHQIRAGSKHRFIATSFVTVDERIFCRRYGFGEPSWYSAFAANSEGQIKLGNRVADIHGAVPADLEAINAEVNQAYFDKLERLGANSWRSWVQDPQVMASTLEIKLR